VCERVSHRARRAGLHASAAWTRQPRLEGGAARAARRKRLKASLGIEYQHLEGQLIDAKLKIAAIASRLRVQRL